MICNNNKWLTKDKSFLDHLRFLEFLQWNISNDIVYLNVYYQHMDWTNSLDNMLV